MKKETRIEVIKEMLGEIQPVGDTYKDDETYENLEIWSQIFRYMTIELFETADYFKDSVAYSCNRAGTKAYSILSVMYNQIEDLIKEEEETDENV